MTTDSARDHTTDISAGTRECAVCGERVREIRAPRGRGRARAHISHMYTHPTHTVLRAPRARSVAGCGVGPGDAETADLERHRAGHPPSSPWRHRALRTRTLRPYPRVTRRDMGAHGCRVPSDSRTCKLRSSAVRAAGTVGSVTPIIESLVTSAASSAPLHPSVPLGRSGSTR